MSEPVVYRCTICEMPISGPTSDVMIGDGDGTGQRFAHGYCYWRREAGREKKRADDLEAALDATPRLPPSPEQVRALIAEVRRLREEVVELRQREIVNFHAYAKLRDAYERQQ